MKHQQMLLNLIMLTQPTLCNSATVRLKCITFPLLWSACEPQLCDIEVIDCQMPLSLLMPSLPLLDKSHHFILSAVLTAALRAGGT